MRRSKLEIYVDVLKVLARHGPLKPTHIMNKVNLSHSFRKRYLDFLVQHKLVQKQISPNKRHKTKAVYTITERGRAILRRFRELEDALPIVEKAKNPLLLFQPAP